MSTTTKVERALALIDQALAQGPVQGRDAFLDAVIAKWEYKYDRFIATDGESDREATASDYVELLGALAARRAAQ